MKTSRLIAAIAGLTMLAANAAHAQQTLIHYWNFNGFSGPYNNPNIPVFHANYSAIDTGKASIVYQLEPGTSSSYGGYIDSVAGDTMNARMGAPAGVAMRLRNPSDSMELRIYAPTTGYKAVAIKYVVESSSTASGQLEQLFDYSVDSGATWKTTGLNMTIDSISQAQFQGTSWGLISLNFGTDTSVNNNAKLVFRIKFSGNTSLTKGNNRFDNLTVEGTSLTQAPSGIATVSPAEAAYNLFPNPASGTVTIATPSTENKTVAIYNLSGQKMNMIRSNEQMVTVNISSLPQGVYYAYIVSGNHTHIMSFIKN